MGKYNSGIVKLVILTLIMSMLPYDVEALTLKDSSKNFKKLTIEDGLSQSSANYTYQDSKGYIWIGTADGLNKYNGQKITTYKIDEKNPKSISSNYISAIIEDNNGNLWIGTSNGLNKYNRKTDDFEVYKPINSEISHYNITEILLDKNNDMWVSTEDGVNIYDNQTNTFKNIFEERDDVLNSLVYTMQIDNNGLLWLGSESGVQIYNIETQEFVEISEEISDTLSNKFIYNMMYDDVENIMWISTDGDGLYKVDLTNGSIKQIGKDEISNNIRDVLKCETGAIWIATSDGLVKYDESNDLLVKYNSEIHDPQSLISDNILSLSQDKEGLIWVGTMEGISIFNPHGLFLNYKHNPFNTNSLSDKMISGVYEDDEGLIWVNTLSKGINVINREVGTVQRYDHTNSNVPDVELSSIDGRGNHIFFGTSQGLLYLDKSVDEFILLKPSKKTQLSNEVRKVYIDDDDNIWVGTRDGLYVLNEDLSFDDYSDVLREQGVNEVFITSIHQDKEDKNIMWFGAAIDGGLIKFNKDTNKVTLYKKDEDKNSLSINSIKSIDEDDKGNLWIGTNYGLNKLDKYTDNIEFFTEADGLANNFVYAALVDLEGNVWCSTNNGISLFDVEKRLFRNFTIADGLNSNEFNGYSYYKSKAGEMFFGSINGLVSFMPSNYQANESISDIVIDKFTIRGTDSVEVNDRIILNHKDNTFNVDFFIPGYSNSKRINYAYMLEGFDDEWIYSKNVGSSNYTNIPSGDYKLNIKGRDSSSEWSEVKTIKISIANPPWKTPVAYWAYIILIGVVIYIWINKVKILEQMVRQRTDELNLKLKENKVLYDKLIKHERYKNNYFVNLSHELRTPLNVILSTQQLITRLNDRNETIPKEKLGEYMNGLKGNSNRLLNLINNIIDTSKIESGSFKINKAENDIVFVVEEVALSMNSLAEEKGINLIIDPEIEEKIIKCDKYHIERCITNLIGNAVKFTNPGGYIIIKIYDFKDTVKISIKDDGIGIDKKYHKAIFDRFGQVFNQSSEEYGGSGLGLTLTSQIISLHSGKIEVISELNEGAEFIITLPV
ncbi:MAG: two-component regulator propeller domain-containing protein [Clostridium sp.]